MTSKSFLSLSLVLLAALALLTSQNGVSAARVLSEADWRGKTEASLKTCLEHAKKLNGMIGIIEKDPSLQKLLPVSRDSIIKTCKEIFELNVDNINGALEALAKNDEPTIGVDLSATGLTTCMDAYSEFGVPFPPSLTREDRVFNQEIDTGLAAVQSAKN